jgi:hypothetical protein
MTRAFRSLPASALALAGVSSLALLLACGGTDSTNAQMQGDGTPAPVSFLVTDAPTDSWSNIGVIIRKVVLIPVGGTAAQGVTVYDGTGDTTKLNLVDLDELAELLGTAQVPSGSYDRLIVTVDGNPSDIDLVASDGTQIPTNQILVRGADPTTKLVDVPVALSAPLVAAAGQPNAVQVDFDLGHPLFVVAHNIGGTTIYTLNFQVRHKPLPVLNQIYLRHLRGQATSVAADSKSFVLRTEHGKDKTLLVDGVNQSLFYDLDATPVTRTASDTTPASLTASKYVKATARFQADGTLTAVRVWYSSDNTKLPKWTPEGHVVKVDTTLNQLRVLRENGAPSTIQVDSNTQFYFQGGTTAIGSGTSFLANLARGFKVHITVADPLATPMVATAVDIQRGVFEGNITAANPTNFTYSKLYLGDTVPETHTVGYNTGFSWWNFTFPTTASTSQADFITKATPASGPLARAASTLQWASNAWAAKVAVFLPSQLSSAPQTISSSYSSGAMVVQYTPDGASSATTLTVKLNTTAGSMPLVTEFSKSGMIVSVTPLATESDWINKLVAGKNVRVYGIPDGTGKLDAYYINLFD